MVTLTLRKKVHQQRATKHFNKDVCAGLPGKQEMYFLLLIDKYMTPVADDHLVYEKPESFPQTDA